jgi:hypothetical protein
MALVLTPPTGAATGTSAGSPDGSASGVLAPLTMSTVLGSAVGTGSQPEPPRYYSVGGMTPDHRKRLHEEDEVLLAILQMFVMEA